MRCGGPVEHRAQVQPALHARARLARRAAAACSPAPCSAAESVSSLLWTTNLPSSRSAAFSAARSSARPADGSASDSARSGRWRAARTRACCAPCPGSGRRLSSSASSSCEQLLAVRLLARRLLRVEAHRVAACARSPSPTTTSLTCRFSATVCVASRAREHLTRSPRRRGAPACTSGTCRRRAASAWKFAAETMPASPTNRQRVSCQPLQVLLDLRHRGHVDRVAREHPVAHRKALARDRQPDDDLRRIARARSSNARACAARA